MSERNEDEIKIIHFRPGQNSKNEGKLEEISIEDFLDARVFYVKAYKNDTVEKRTDVVIKAKEWVERELRYSFIGNDCENFAEYCWTGKM